jgi:hypothetical protein
VAGEKAVAARALQKGVEDVQIGQRRDRGGRHGSRGQVEKDDQRRHRSGRDGHVGSRPYEPAAIARIVPVWDEIEQKVEG